MDRHRALLNQIESQWPIEIHRGLADLLRQNPGETFYAGAFWILYCDYTVISAPIFGVNAESMLTDEGVRWAPAEWHWDVLKPVCEAMEPYYERLSASLAGAPHSEWQAVMTANEELVGRVSRSVTHAARSRSGDFADLALPDNFLVFAGDVREDGQTFNRQLRLSVEADELSTLGMVVPEG